MKCNPDYALLICDYFFQIIVIMNSSCQMVRDQTSVVYSKQNENEPTTTDNVDQEEYYAMVVLQLNSEQIKTMMWQQADYFLSKYIFLNKLAFN